MHTDKMYPWQTAMIQAITDPAELWDLLELPPAILDEAKKAARLFPLKVPRRFLERMEKGNLNDPLLRQILPIGEELAILPGYDADPLQENQVNPVPGLLHKYHGRALVTLTGTCGIHCRYCFRRYFPYADNITGSKGWGRILDYLASDPSIVEVILSGGDPLVLPDNTLKQFIAALETIPQLKRLRIHSRLPIVLPERITLEWVNMMAATRFQTILVTHCNHPNELALELARVFMPLRHAGIMLLNQSVLLKQVNDTVETLVKLSEQLFAVGIQPYYLHVLDKVQGAAQFDLTRQTASQLHWEMTKKLPGYLVPKLVCEQPGMPAKLPIVSSDFYTD